METNLVVIRDEIITGIPNDEFDSHEFIRNFAKRFEIKYVEFLSLYKQEPFRNVHAQIGKFLLEHQVLLQIKDNGPIQSPNIFGIESQNETLIKIE
jgi:hypothetical protein